MPGIFVRFGERSPENLLDKNRPETANLTEKSKAHNKVTKCHTLLAQDSFLGSLLVLPGELTKGITG